MAKYNRLEYDPKSREDWLRVRRLGIGGSDASTVLARNPWGTRLALWMDKRGLLEEREETDAMEMGKRLEPVIVDMFEDRSGKTVHRVNSILQSVEHPFMLANLDGRIVGENAGFEAKTSYTAESWEDGDVPSYYYDQVQHYMAVTGFEAFYVGCLVQGRKFYWTKVLRDESHIKYLVQEETDFWRMVCDGVMPASTPEETLRQLERDNPTHTAGLQIALDIDLASRLANCKRILNTMEAEEAKLRMEVLESMRDAESAVFSEPTWSVKVTWKLADGRITFDSETFKADHKDLWEKYQKQSAPKRAPRFYVNFKGSKEVD
jgi:putative phage-type endonuclease